MTLMELCNVINFEQCRLIVHRKDDDPMNDFDSAVHSRAYLSVLANSTVMDISISNKNWTDNIYLVRFDVPVLHVTVSSN